MSRLLAIFLVTFTVLTSSVLAFSNGPGTCLVAGMKGVPHGAAPSKNLTITADVMLVSAGTYTITITGGSSVTGLLLYAVDSNGTRFGSFSKPPTGFGPKTGCGGNTPATNTLGHINAAPKALPLTFTWSDGGYLAKSALTASFAGIAMTSTESVWYVLASGQIPTSSAPAPSGGSSSAALPSSLSPSTTIPSAGGAAASATTSAVNSTDVYSYGAKNSSSTIQVYWSLVVAALLSVFATFLL